MFLIFFRAKMKKQVIMYGENSGIIEKMRAKSLIFPVLLTLIERGGGGGGGGKKWRERDSVVTQPGTKHTQERRGKHHSRSNQREQQRDNN
jgi:hypothetical protein